MRSSCARPGGPVKDPRQSGPPSFRTTPGETHGWFFLPRLHLLSATTVSSFSDLSLFAFGMAVTSSDLPATSPEATPRNRWCRWLPAPRKLLQGGAQPHHVFFLFLANYFPMLGSHSSL